jgi:DNA-binding transcriptional MerR regulator
VTSSTDRQPPVRLYYRIGEVSEIVGVEPHVLRYWEQEFRSIKPQKSRKGQRIYSRRDVERLLRVKDLLYTHGYTIAGARKQLRNTGAEPAAPGDPVQQSAHRMRDALLELRRDVLAMLSELQAPAPSRPAEASRDGAGRG